MLSRFLDFPEFFVAKNPDIKTLLLAIVQIDICINKLIFLQTIIALIES